MAENWVVGPTITDPHRWTYAELDELIPRGSRRSGKCRHGRPAPIAG